MLLVVQFVSTNGREVGTASQEEVKLGVGYTINGEELPFGMMPSTLEDLASVEVVYESTCQALCVGELRHVTLLAVIVCSHAWLEDFHCQVPHL